MPNELSPREMKQICREIYEGDLLQAVFRYQQASGKGLKESRQFIEMLTVRLREENPERFPQPRPQSGCTVVLVGAALWAMWWFV